jgi:hypothetical protein
MREAIALVVADILLRPYAGLQLKASPSCQ